MKISLAWLNELVEYSATPAELAHRLTMAGLEVESIDDEAARFEKIVVGHVVTRIKHPNADTLSVCTVDIGGGVIQEIVCGAPNVDAGQKVAVALVGAKMGDFVISKRKLRGVVSNGMICSERELGLGDKHEGIMVLDPSAPVGKPFAEFFGSDTMFDIGITPNRPDALSHIGIARDVAALYGSLVKRPVLALQEDIGLISPIDPMLSVEIQDAAACPRYVARVIKGITVGPSPDWLVRRLERIGLRSINNVVDATNYVLMECGHPLHAFDYDQLADHKVVVRCAAEGEKFTTLDGKERTLRADTLLICDAKRGVAIAGVMGGKNAEITNATKNIVIESAYFNPSSIRRTSKFLGLSTDASYRFERGTDVDNAVYAADRVAALIQEIAGGEIAAGRIDTYPTPRAAETISVRTERVNALLGSAIAPDEMIAICKRLNFNPRQTGDVIVVDVPSWRPDMHEEVDVIEEIARIAGYDRFLPKDPHVSVPVRSAKQVSDHANTIREFFVANGYSEIVTNSLIDEKSAAKFSPTYVKVANPISGDMAIVRPHPLPQALAAIALNARYGTKNAKVFELANSYTATANDSSSALDRYEGTEWLTCLMTGSVDGSWDKKPRPVDFFDLKGDVERLLRRVALDNYQFIAYNYDENRELTAQSATITLAGQAIGSIGQVSKEVLRMYDIDADVYAATIHAAPLRSGGNQSRYMAPPRFPWVVRDIAVVAPREVTAATLAAALKKSAASPLLRDVRVFDVFEGPSLGASNRSVAFSLTFGADDRTLVDKEIDDVMANIVNVLQQKHQWSIRA